MTNRIFRSICLVALAVFLASLVLILGVVYNYYSQLQQEQLRIQTGLIAQGASHEGLAYFSNLYIDNVRVTWIKEDGTVLYDNHQDPTEPDNFLLLKEVQDALQFGTGESFDASSTLLERSLYCACRLPDGTVLRLADTQHSPLTLILGFAQPICMVIAVALIVSLLLAFRLSRKVVEPLNRLELDSPMQAECYEELTPLLRRLDAQQCQLRSQASALARKENEWNAVTGNMKQGLVLLSSNCQILSINAAARRLLGLHHGSIGTDILVCHKELSGILLQALNGDRAEKILELKGAQYQIEASPVITDSTVSGIVLLMVDLTEKQKAEKLRREFTANVSHELKTPLHTISGYAELMHHGIAKPEDTASFSGQIYTEAQRMIRLVEDILRLSQLEEGSDALTWETFDLYAASRELLKHLTVTAEAASITLSLEGTSTTVDTVPHLATAIMKNLFDNAIKYNRPRGSVTVRIEQVENQAILRVTDTGIGIPQEHQERIFERFYRVDKSHSKAVGGTGLGLSIVKHAAAQLGARITLVSQPGEGTTITVAFPAEGIHR